jgi:hypothetical protein
VFDHDVGALASCRLLDRLDHVVLCVVDLYVGLDASELVRARRGDDGVRSERACDRVRGHGDASADAPDQHSLSLLQPRSRDEHPVRGDEHERERRSLLEAHPVGDRVDVLPRHGHELRVRAVHVLAIDGDVIAVIDPGVHDDAVTGREAGPGLDDAGAVGSEDAGLGRRRSAAPHPQVDAVERGRAQPDQDVARSRLGIRSVLVAEDFRPPVFVDSDRLQGRAIVTK